MSRAKPFVRARLPQVARNGAYALLLTVLTLRAVSARAAEPDSAGVVVAAVAAKPATVSAPRLGGYLQFREYTQERAGLSAMLNRVRLTADGTLPAQVAYKVMVEYQASAGVRNPATVSLREGFVRWSREALVVTGGEFKTPFSREYLISTAELELADLAVAVDSLATRYDIGVMGEYAFGSVVTYSLGVFNGEGPNSTVNRDSTALLVSRLVVHPSRRLAFGASASHEGGDSLRWGLDLDAEHPRAKVRAEYLTRHVRGRAPGKDDFGWYLFESVSLTPRVQALARQEDFQRPWYGPARRVRGLAWGANFDVAPGRAKVLFEMSRRMTDTDQHHTDTFLAQVQARF